MMCNIAGTASNVPVMPDDAQTQHTMMRTDELDFELPPELIAQTPSPERSASRLLHFRRADGAVAHHVFRDLPALLQPGDLLIFNDARVIPARFLLRKQTGGLVEGLFLDEPRPSEWRVLLRDLGRSGGPLHFDAAPQISARVLEAAGEGQFRLAVQTAEPAATVLERVGRMPLPPYIRRQKVHDDRDDLDRGRYQTVFAQVPGAIAAPTAALHFSQPLLDALMERGVERAFVTLSVGMGTFKPITAERLDDHVMHVEHFSVDEEAANALNRAKAEGRRLIAVGTTAARVLESCPAGARFTAHTGQTGIFIRAPYQWKHVDALITNFHLPRSTLIALVAAMTGLDEQRRLYRIAIENKYRFFSYGDAMFIE